MSPILINTAEPMAMMKVVAIKDDSEKLLKVLQKTGVLHIEESHELQPVDKARIDSEHREINELSTYVNKILANVPEDQSISIENDVEVIYTQAFSEIRDEIKQIYNRTNRLQERIDTIDAEYIELKDTDRYLKPLSEITNVTLKDLNYTGSYLVSRVIAVSKDSYERVSLALKDIATEHISTDVENETVIHIVADKRNLEKIEIIVNNLGGTILSIPTDDITLSEYLNSGSAQITSLEENKARLVQELQDIIGEDLKKLVLLREALNAENERLSVLEKATEAKYVTVVEGWVPKNISETAMADIKEQIDYAFVDLRDPEEGEEPPTEFKNPKAMKPFQVVVNLFATPKYREWDPTPIVSYSFAFFFGLMVCDVLYAIGIMLMAKFLLGKFVDDTSTAAFKTFQRLLYICSGVALIGGLLTGQYFGDIYTFLGIESLALVEGVKDALQDPVTFIVISLGIGFIHVNIGHILAFAKAVKERDKGNIVNKVGLFIFELGVPTIVHSLLGVDIPGFTPEIYSILSYCMIVGIVMIVVANLMLSGGLGAIMWLFDITGLLGDVMSYARLAGVSLATYYLAFTFNMLAKMFPEMLSGSPVGLIAGILIGVILVVFGHAINLVMAAISGFMHSLRLCFVEFLFKFYEGGGVEYSPFRLVKRTSVSISGNRK